MDINKTRLGLIYIFSENEKISNKAKLQLINFIEQADEHQLKVLMMDGDLVSKDKLDEQAREIVNDRFSALPELKIALEKASLEGIEVVTEIAPLVAAGAAGIVGVGVGSIMLKKRICKKRFPDNPERYKRCLRGNVFSKKNKPDK